MKWLPKVVLSHGFKAVHKEAADTFSFANHDLDIESKTLWEVSTNISQKPKCPYDVFGVAEISSEGVWKWMLTKASESLKKARVSLSP